MQNTHKEARLSLLDKEFKKRKRKKIKSTASQSKPRTPSLHVKIKNNIMNIEGDSRDTKTTTL